jgi:uncharacterized delta-60 repeat protein
MQIALRAFLPAVVLLSMACGSSSSSSGTSQPSLSSILVTPSPATIQSGKTQQLTAVAKDSNGNAMSGISFAWKSDASNVASVDAAGLVTGSLAGKANITASAQGVTSAAVSVTVTPGALASIRVQPVSVQLAVGDPDAQLSAMGLDVKENLIAGLSFDWKSDNASAATVQAAGDPSAAAVHAIAADGEQTATAQISVSVGDFHASATVTVKPTGINSIAVTPSTAAIHIGASQAFAASASQDSLPVSGVSFTWKSSDDAVVSVDEKTGLAKGLAAGKATITASARGVSSKPGGELTVANDVMVVVSPPPQPVLVTATQELKVAVANALKDATVTWSIAEANGGTIERTGPNSALYTAPCRKGPFHVVATSNEDKSKSGTATINLCVPASGLLDPCFNKIGMASTPIGPSAAANAMALQPDGKIVVVGKASDGKKMDFAVARYTPEGALDDSFGTKGVVLTDFGLASEARAVALQDDGKVVAAGSAGRQMAVARYTADGKADTTFNASGTWLGRGTVLQTNSASAVLVQRPSGRIVVGGSHTSTICPIRLGCETLATFQLVGLKPDGTADTSFASGLTSIGDGSFAELAALAVQSDGKLIGVGSAADSVSGKPGLALARWTATGTVDTQFGSNADGTAILVFGDEAAANAVAIQPDQRIVVAGRVLPAGSMRGDSFALARFTADGKLDHSFGTPIRFGLRTGTAITSLLDADDSLYAMQLQGDGAIVVAGEARETATKLLRFTVLRYTPAGEIDAKFNEKGIAIAPFGDQDASARAVAFTSESDLSKTLITVVGSYGTQFALARYWP